MGAQKMDRPTALRVLGLDQNADKARISQAFIALAKKYGPEAQRGMPLIEQLTTESRLGEITAAHNVLSSEPGMASFAAILACIRKDAQTPGHGFATLEQLRYVKFFQSLAQCNGFKEETDYLRYGIYISRLPGNEQKKLQALGFFQDFCRAMARQLQGDRPLTAEHGCIVATAVCVGGKNNSLEHTQSVLSAISSFHIPSLGKPREKPDKTGQKPWNQTSIIDISIATEFVLPATGHHPFEEAYKCLAQFDDAMLAALPAYGNALVNAGIIFSDPTEITGVLGATLGVTQDIPKITKAMEVHCDLFARHFSGMATSEYIDLLPGLAASDRLNKKLGKSLEILELLAKGEQDWLPGFHDRHRKKELLAKMLGRDDNYLDRIARFAKKLACSPSIIMHGPADFQFGALESLYEKVYSKGIPMDALRSFMRTARQLSLDQYGTVENAWLFFDYVRNNGLDPKTEARCFALFVRPNAVKNDPWCSWRLKFQRRELSMAQQRKDRLLADHEIKWMVRDFIDTYFAHKDARAEMKKRLDRKSAKHRGN